MREKLAGCLDYLDHCSSILHAVTCCGWLDWTGLDLTVTSNHLQHQTVLSSSYFPLGLQVHWATQPSSFWPPQYTWSWFCSCVLVINWFGQSEHKSLRLKSTYEINKTRSFCQAFRTRSVWVQIRTSASSALGCRKWSTGHVRQTTLPRF